MSETIEILDMGPHEYAVTVGEGPMQTQHRVTVPPGLLDELGLTRELESVDDEEGAVRELERRLVRESFGFLLEREPATSILPEFRLDVISRYFPGYLRELRTRLRTAP